MAEPQNILVIKLGALGDFIQAFGPMSAIRKKHPHAKITLLTTAPYESFAQECQYFDDVWLDEKPSWINVLGWFRLKKRLHEGCFDRVYDLQNNDRTSLYFKLFKRSQKPEWVGATKGASHANLSKERTQGHAFEGHRQTLTLAGIKDVRVDSLDWMHADIASFPLQKPFILVVPGSAPNRPEKRWPEEHYGRVCEIVHGWGYQPVLLGTKAEQASIDAIVKLCPEALDLGQQTSLEHLASLARGASAAIGNDTGPMHLIAATGCPSFVIFSPFSDPVKHKPLGDQVEVIQAELLKDLEPEMVLKKLKPRHDSDKAANTLH